MGCKASSPAAVAFRSIPKPPAICAGNDMGLDGALELSKTLQCNTTLMQLQYSGPPQCHGHPSGFQYPQPPCRGCCPLVLPEAEPCAAAADHSDYVTSQGEYPECTV